MKNKKDISPVLESLRHVPAILKSLLAGIPAEYLKQQRIPGKWSIHEHVCHLAEVQAMLYERMTRFIAEEKPEFIPYHPDAVKQQKPLIEQNMKECLNTFESKRAAFIKLGEQLPEAHWEKNAIHPEYALYTPFVMYRHCLLHDHLHMYRIEELSLASDVYFKH